MGYYTGDYYQGDPGLLGTIGKGIMRIGGVALRASPIGRAVTIAGGIASGVGIVRSFAPPGPGFRLPLPGGRFIQPGAALPGGRPLFGRSECPAGFHLDKKYHAKCVRNRSMNPANPRALRRAIRRERGFVSLARRVLKGSGLTIGRKGMGGKSRGRGGRCKKCR